MTKDDIQLLYEYDRWANNRVFNAASALDNEKFTRDLGSPFHSLRGTLVHLIGGEWIWLEYWKDPLRSSASITELRARRDVLFSQDAAPDLAAVRDKWTKIERDQIEFVNGITNERLNQMLPFRTTHVSLANLMQHLANHSTYHRGQIALMLRQLGVEALATDFHVFLAAGRTEAAAPA